MPRKSYTLQVCFSAQHAIHLVQYGGRQPARHQRDHLCKKTENRTETCLPSSKHVIPGRTRALATRYAPMPAFVQALLEVHNKPVTMWPTPTAQIPKRQLLTYCTQLLCIRIPPLVTPPSCATRRAGHKANGRPHALLQRPRAHRRSSLRSHTGRGVGCEDVRASDAYVQPALHHAQTSKLCRRTPAKEGH